MIIFAAVPASDVQLIATFCGFVAFVLSIPIAIGIWIVGARRRKSQWWKVKRLLILWGVMMGIAFFLANILPHYL